MKLNRKAVTVEFRPNRKRGGHTSDSLFSKGETVLSHAAKCNIDLAMLSNRHFGFNQ